MASSVAAMASFRWAEAIVITTDASPTGTVPTLKADLTVFPDYLPMDDDNPLQRGIRVPQLGTQLPQLLVGHVVVGLIIQADDCPSVEGVSRRSHKDRLRATGGAEEGRSAFSSSSYLFTIFSVSSTSRRSVVIRRMSSVNWWMRE